MSEAPVALFTYNRVSHLRKTIEALRKNESAICTPLFIFSDAAKTREAIQQVKEVREYLKTVNGFKSVNVIERNKNYGLGKNIIDGVTEVVERFGRVIVLEDDLITSPFFLNYMNEALDLYQDDEKVISVHGYVYPIRETLPETFFIRGADCLGWATWKRGWNLFQPNGKILLTQLEQSGELHAFDYDGAYPYVQMLRDQLEGKNDSWAVRWYASSFLSHRYTLFPGRSLVYHAGGDGSGTNGFDQLLDVELSTSPIKVEKIDVRQDEQAYAAFRDFLKKLAKPNLGYRIKRRLYKLLSK